MFTDLIEIASSSQSKASQPEPAPYYDEAYDSSVYSTESDQAGREFSSIQGQAEDESASFADVAERAFYEPKAEDFSGSEESAEMADLEQAIPHEILKELDRRDIDGTDPKEIREKIDEEFDDSSAHLLSALDNVEEVPSEREVAPELEPGEVSKKVDSEAAARLMEQPRSIENKTDPIDQPVQELTKDSEEISSETEKGGDQFIRSSAKQRHADPEHIVVKDVVDGLEERTVASDENVVVEATVQKPVDDLAAAKTKRGRASGVRAKAVSDADQPQVDDPEKAVSGLHADTDRDASESGVGNSGEQSENNLFESADSDDSSDEWQSVLARLTSARAETVGGTSAESVMSAGSADSETTLVRLERITDLVEKLGEKLVDLAEKTPGRMKITLNPANLGQITMSCREVDGELRFEVLAENRDVRALLINEEAQIRDIVENSGYKLSQFDVMTQNEDLRDSRHSRNPVRPEGPGSVKAAAPMTAAPTGVDHLTGLRRTDSGVWLVA